MHPTSPVAHLHSVTTVDNTDDDMKIYEFDREASMDLFIGVPWSNTAPGWPFVAFDDVLAA